MACKYIYLLPILVFMWFPLTFLITFIIAVVLGHVNPIFPYISDSGTTPPESCVFGQLINIGSLLFGLVMYIRYRQIREIFHTHDLPVLIQRLNYISTCVGFTGALGVSFVGNFQETNALVIHLLAATVGFGLGSAYLVLQTVLSYKIYPISGKKWILYTRILISCFCILTFCLCYLFGILSIISFKGKFWPIPKWSKQDGGYGFHISSAINEWLTALSVMSYILTFTPEFKKISLSEPILYIEEQLLIDPLVA